MTIHTEKVLKQYMKEVLKKDLAQILGQTLDHFSHRGRIFKGAFLVENDSEFIIRKDLFFNINLKYIALLTI